MIKFVKDKRLHDMVVNQIGNHPGRCTEKDVNKEMEMLIAQNFFGPGYKYSGPKDIREEWHGIDIWVNDRPVQIKCNKDSHLVLEDHIFRNGEWKPGCIDTCEATELLKVWPEGSDTVVIKNYPVELLKQIVNASRKYYENGIIDPILDYVSGPGKWFNNKDMGGSFFIYS